LAMDALASNMAGLSTEPPGSSTWTESELAAMRETLALLKGTSPMPDPKLLAATVLCTKCKPADAAKKIQDWAKVSRDDWQVELSTAGLRLNIADASSEEWTAVAGQIDNSYAACGGDAEGRGIFWIRGGHIAKEAIESGAAMRAGLLFWLACHADLSTMRSGVSMVIDNSKTASADMRRSGIEGKLHKGFQSFPLRPQCIRIIVTSSAQRILVNAVIKAATVFSRQKVLRRILFVTAYVDVAAALPLASMPKYAGGDMDEVTSAWVLRRLDAFPALPGDLTGAAFV
jgi:hypothetical protein